METASFQPRCEIFEKYIPCARTIVCSIPQNEQKELYSVTDGAFVSKKTKSVQNTVYNSYGENGDAVILAGKEILRRPPSCNVPIRVTG